MKIESFAERFTLINDNKVRCHLLGLYDRVGFVDEFATKKYICIYEDSPTLTPRDTIDRTACVIFERTINPYVDPRIYICIKIGNKMREDLRCE